MKCEKTFFTKYHQFVSWNRTGILFKNLLTFTLITRDFRCSVLTSDTVLIIAERSVAFKNPFEPPFLDSY